MKTETRHKIEEALQAVAQLREEYPLDVNTFTRPDELEVYEIEVLNEGKIYQERKSYIFLLVRVLAKHITPEESAMHVVFDVACKLQRVFELVKKPKNPRISLHAALNHMEQQLQEFLINGLYDELQDYFQ